MRNSLLILLTAVVAVSCTGKKVYDTYNHTPIAGWEKNDTLVFQTPPVGETGSYATSVGIRINDLYPFMGLTLIVEQTILPGKQTVTDTLNCHLIDEDGVAQGQGVSYYQYSFPVTQLSLQAGDSLVVHVRHDMKREILPGISDVGFKMVRQ